MLITRYTSAASRRRGVILIVVLAMLTLFAIVGISFVMVAQAQETSARIAREAESETRPDIDPEGAFAFAMGQVLYGCNDDANFGIYSSLRGHDLAASIYGWEPTTPNDKPFSGLGRLRYTNAGANDPTKPGWNDEAYMMNFKYFPVDGFLRDPNRLPRAFGAAQNPYLGGPNVPYTYPDHNNFFLAEIDPVTGRIVTPSFHREYLFGRLDALATGPTPNQNWTNKIGKYLTVRPRTQENPGFPYPVDQFGDVKNLDNAPGGCDSVWIDINAPVLNTKDGRKYKMLIAPLILSLDGRLDLNVVGNMLGTGSDHRSNQGWGVWEVNPAKVLDLPAEPWQNLFNGSTTTGTARISGRFLNSPRQPAGNPLGTGYGIRGWAQVDFDGMNDDKSMSQALTLPTTYNAFPGFPATTFKNGGGTPAEKDFHPSTAYFYKPDIQNRRLPLRDMVPLLRFGGTNSDALPTDAGRLFRQTFFTDANAQKRRNLVTLLSADLGRPGATPYVWDPAEMTATPTTRLQLQTAADGQFTLAGNNPIAFPGLPAGAPPANSEFDATTWRSVSASLRRIDFYRPNLLKPYPNAPTGLLDLNNATTATDVETSTKDRQKLAQEIYDILRKVTGAREPTDAYALGISSPEFRALRYLAQLAANIVDYVDTDGFSTTFNWFNDATTSVNEFVYGVETPRLVLNEVYAQYDNDNIALVVDAGVPGGMKVNTATAMYGVNVWVELHNPMTDDSGLSATTDTTVFLQPGGIVANGADHPYRILLCDADIYANIIRSPENPEGDPNYGGGNRIRKTVRYWGDPNSDPKQIQTITPGAGVFNDDPATPTGKGFYVIGPKYETGAGATKYRVAGNNPNTATNFLSADMTYEVVADAANTTAKQRPTVVLQRLANPVLPYNQNKIANNAINPFFNPYITVDVVANTDAQVWDGRDYTINGQQTAAAMPMPGDFQPMADRASAGRNQPWAGHALQRRASVTAVTNQPKNTFFRQNSVEPDPTMLTNADANLKTPFDWMTHLDRSPINAMELLHVSHCRPSELLAFFVDGVGTGAPHKHVAPWIDDTVSPVKTSRLYRFLEFVDGYPIRTWNTNLDRLGRTPGKVNLNGIWNAEILQALADPQNGNGFNAGNIATSIFPAMLASRSPASSATVYSDRIRPTDKALHDLAVSAGLVQPMLPDGTAGRPDSPFWSLTLGAAEPVPPADSLGTSPRGIGNTVLRPGVFDVPGATHPYRQKELLTKIFNSVTTRSNVFAVWLTVGYFEVTDEDKNGNGVLDPGEDLNGNGILDRVLLGAELNKSENRHIRHRMFSIVDRTQMTVFETTSTAAVAVGTNQAVGLAPQGATNVTNPLPAQYSVRDPRTGRDLLIRDGMTVTFEPNTANEETVTIKRDVTTGALTATFELAHALNCVVVYRGNPGPWTRYDPRQDPAVVPYFALID